MATYRMEIHHLFQAIDTMWTRTDDMPVQQMLCLLAIARQPGITAEALGKAVGINQTSVSRNTMALSEWHRLGNRARA
jgi:DNA-binding MarR family transcriptional regulator